MIDSEVKAASDAFYAALNRMFAGDLGPMAEVWSHAPDVTNMGPFGGRQVGWEAVHREFQWETGLKLGGRVVPRDVMMAVSGTLGYTLCLEVGENMTMAGEPIRVHHRATNIFRLENGAWKLVHHHTDAAPALQEEIKRQTG